MDQAQTEAPCMAVWDMTGSADPQGIPSTCQAVVDLNATYRVPDGALQMVRTLTMPVIQQPVTSHFLRIYFRLSGYGAAVMYSQDGSEFSGWILNTGTPENSMAGFEKHVAFDGTTFSYTDGYKNYLYSGEGGEYPEIAGKYFTNFWAGEATVE